MKQARLAAGWLLQKKKLLPVLIVMVMVGVFSAPAFVLHTSAITPDPITANSADALWLDNYKTLVYKGDKYTGPSSFIGKGTLFVSSNKTDKGCEIGIIFSGNYKTATTAQYATQNYGSTNPGAPARCNGFGSGTTISVNPTANNTNANPTGTNGGTGSDGSTDSVDPCDVSGNVLSWFICPLIDLFNQGIIQMQHVIDNLMAINVGDVFDTKKSPGSNYYAAWNTFRIFGVVLIIIAGLLMVISQALGFEIFDAYTVKKVLPRLFVAAIGISLSWWLLMYLAEITNDLGLGIRGVIYYPFRNMGDASLQNTGSFLITLLFGSAALWALSIGGVLSLIVTAGLAALVAFVVLIIREILLIFLIIIAPLAIACYVLPNTEKAYKLWWDSTFKGMLMFPIISGFIAVGRVFSIVASNADGNGVHTAVNQVIALIAFFLPYFALPFTFRLAGGAIATIGGLANDRSRGVFDGLKNYRKGKTASNWQATKDGTRTNVGAVNRMTARATTPRLGFGARGRSALNQKMDLAAMNFAKSAQGQAIQHNDNALRAMTYGSEAQARANMARDWNMYTTDANGNQVEDREAISSAIAATKANGGFGQARQVYAAQQLAATGTGYDNIEQAAQTIARTSNGNADQAASLAGNINSATKQAGRFDLAPGYANLNALAQAEMGGGASQAQYQAATVAAVRGVDAVSMLRGKPREVSNLTTSLAAHAQATHQRIATARTDPERQAATDEFIQTMGQIDQLNQSKSYASDENQAHVNALMNDTQQLRTQAMGSLLGTPPLVHGPGGRAVPDPNWHPSSLTQDQINNRERYEQVRSPRYNPNDPNNP